MSAILTRRFDKAVLGAALFAAALLAAVVVVGVPDVPLSGGRTGLLLGFGIFVLPLVAVFAITRPVASLFALWAALVPWDYLLQTHAGAASVERLLGYACGGAAIVHLLVRRRGTSPPRAILAWAGVVVWMLVTIMWSSQATRGSAMIATIAGMLVLGAAVASVRLDVRDLAYVLGGIVIGGASAAVYSTIVASPTTTGRVVLQGGLLGNGNGNVYLDPNHVAASLVLPAIIATIGAMAARERFIRLVAGSLAAVIFLGMLLSQSRGGLIALAAGLLYVMVRSQHRVWSLPVLGAGVVALIARPSGIQRFASADLMHGDGRSEIWKVGAAAFRHHWLWGAGFGAFRDAYQAAYLEVYQPTAFRSIVQDSHNLLVQTGVELGLVGVVLMLVAWWQQLRVARTIPPSAGGWFQLRIAVEASTIAIFVDAMTLDLLTFKYLWLNLATMWIVASAYRAGRRGSAASPAGLPKARSAA